MIKQKLNHLEHIEDLIFEDGARGARRALQFINRLITHDPNLLTNVKVDGSPSLVVGLVPSGEPNAGQFFVGTKSALSQRGKRYTQENAGFMFKENSPELAHKLFVALNYLPKIGLDRVYQGDLLFADNIEHVHINESYCHTFKPNVITYTVPIDSETGRKINYARIGIILHTVYQGNTFAKMHATYNPDFSKLKHCDQVFWKSNKVELSYSKSDVIDINSHLRTAGLILSRIDRTLFTTIKARSGLVELIKLHINSNIRRGRSMNDIEFHISELIAFINDRLNAEAMKLKTQAGKRRTIDRGAAYVEIIESNRSEFFKMFDFFNEITLAKLAVLNRLQSLDGIESFYKEDGVYRKTSGEGLVVACVKTNDIVKLVDRLDFSRINFQQPKDWIK